MTNLSISQARSQISELANEVAYAKERICIERNGKAVAVLVPLEDVLLLEHLEDKMDLELVKKALKRGDFIGLEELKKELNL